MGHGGKREGVDRKPKPDKPSKALRLSAPTKIVEGARSVTR